MFSPEWDEGCKHCSFWADHFNAFGVHLSHRDVSLVAVSRAPLARIEAQTAVGALLDRYPDLRLIDGATWMRQPPALIRSVGKVPVSLDGQSREVKL